MKAQRVILALALGIGGCDGADGGTAGADAGADSGGVADAAPDAVGGDAGVADAASDTGGPDSGVTDAGGPDTGGTDAGMVDTGPADTGDPDTAMDAGDVASDAVAPDAGADAASDAGDGGSPGCTAPLDDETLANLTFGLLPSVQLQPGQSHDFTLGTVECCYFFTPVDACVEWSVAPEGAATLDAEGHLTVPANAVSGTKLTVTADVEDGRRVLSIDVWVYTPQDNPLVGYWREEAGIDCVTGEDLPVQDPVNELRFDASGDFFVTWYPFEVYYDYWGSYAFTADGAITLAVEGGNYVPPDVDGSGTFQVQGDTLVLEGIWLGSYQGEEGPAACGHRFAAF